MENRQPDFSGWATKFNILCADGRTIMRGAFKDSDGEVVPLVYNHGHKEVNDVLGHALLEERPEGMYCYGWFNNTESGKHAKESVINGDITRLSIYANKLKQLGGNVQHGFIREVSLVLAGANPDAVIDACFAHGEYSDEEAIIYSEDIDCIKIEHSGISVDADNGTEKNNIDNRKEEQKTMETSKSEKTIKDIFDTLTEEQKQAVYAIVGYAVEDAKKEKENTGDNMKHSIFDNNSNDVADDVLSHSDEQGILSMAKSTSVGSLRDAINIFCEQNDCELAHSFDHLDYLFPEMTNIPAGKPDVLTRDQEWVSNVLANVQKSPMTRIRTRQADARAAELRAKGYVKGNKKANMANIALIKRETIPQTIYIKSELNKDDIDDITSFDVVEAEYSYMKQLLNEELATAIMIGDFRETGDPDKIEESHIRPIWTDADLYTIHKDVDIESVKAAVQGTGTATSFGDNFIYAEAVVEAALNSRIDYKGSGNLTFYCTPSLLNKMLLAKDMNGRRIYNSVADLAAALNVKNIITAEQFENRTRTATDGSTKKLLGIFVNLGDYHLGAVNNGQVSKFDQFDIDYNKQKMLLETRASGALTKLYSAIAIEEDVVEDDTADTN